MSAKGQGRAALPLARGVLLATNRALAPLSRPRWSLLSAVPLVVMGTVIAAFHGTICVAAIDIASAPATRVAAPLGATGGATGGRFGKERRRSLMRVEHAQEPVRSTRRQLSSTSLADLGLETEEERGAVAVASSVSTAELGAAAAAASAGASETWIGSPHVRCATTQGDLLIDLDSKAAPIGVKHFLKLVSDGVFRNNAVFHGVKGFGLQMGISSDENVNRRWDVAIMDDPIPEFELPHIRKGTVFLAGNGPNSRGTQVFIALADLPQLGSNPWEIPIGRVVSSDLDTLEKFYTGYGEQVDQSLIRERGRAYLNQFPKLDYVKNCIQI